ncbi:Sodium/hydrogen exchanger 8 [Plecturocebus cupreus]
MFKIETGSRPLGGTPKPMSQGDGHLPLLHEQFVSQMARRDSFACYGHGYDFGNLQEQERLCFNRAFEPQFEQQFTLVVFDSKLVGKNGDDAALGGTWLSELSLARLQPQLHPMAWHILSPLIVIYVLKHIDLRKTPSLEFGMMIIFAYLPYGLAEGISLSGIMAILFSGIVMSHYTHHNLSPVTQILMQQTLRTVAFLCETCVFAFLGLSIFSFPHKFEISFVIWCIVKTHLTAWPTWQNPVSTKNTKISRVQWRVPVIPATWKAEAGESLEPGRWKLHLGDKVRHCLKNGWAWWLTPVIQALWRPRRADHLRLGVQDQPDQHSETLSLKKIKIKNK